MAAKKFTCTNFANCDAALSKQVIEIEDGEDVLCPSCKGTNTLVAAGGAGGGTAAAGGSGGSKKKLIIAALAVVVIALAVWVFWPSSPNRELANTMLGDFFTRLK